MDSRIYTFTSKEGFTTCVEPERWQWGVVYKDGSELHQFGEDGIFHQIGEVKQEKIEMATLFKPEDQSRRIDIPWSEGMRLVHRYINIRPPSAELFLRVYVFGFKFEGNHSFNFVLPDDRFILSATDSVDLTKFAI